LAAIASAGASATSWSLARGGERVGCPVGAGQHRAASSGQTRVVFLNPTSNVLQRHVRPHLVGPSKRDRGPRGELKGCGLSAAVRRLQTWSASNVRPGRHIDRYRIAHSGGQTIILMGREEIAVVIFNVSRVEHPVDGGRKQGLIGTVLRAVLTETLQTIDGSA
jgi:hypothetical protein